MHKQSRSIQLVLVFVSLLPVTLSHIALWDEGMYGWDPNDPNQSEPVYPLAGLPFSQWWFHGYINTPPPAGAMMTLPSGGTYHGQVACNKALTTYGSDPSQQTGQYACDTIGPLHTADAWGSANPTDVKGCGIAIAYESDVTQIKPEDFAVISVNYTCPWKKDVDFQIPEDLPPCPEGGCHCMWGWIHSSDSGSEQMYFVGYRCNITGATGTQPIPKPQVARKCNYPTDTSNCTSGVPRQPHYWFQAEDNNNFQGTYDPPFCEDNGAYGFMDGAQTDLFTNASSPSLPSSSSNAQSSSTTIPAATTASVLSAVVVTSSSSSTHTAEVNTTRAAVLPVSHTTSNSSLVRANPASATTASFSTTSQSSSSPVNCKRRRRALSNLSSPENLQRHQARQIRRVARKTAQKHDLGRDGRLAL